ncbi:hypothetical protein Cgig2_028648 [Carnegiea gigantea]|uniref:Uncharacterized protein n=1 Tax=Carnegiea gigantea TaxID=171969 RepID=A0A9Q1Q8D5_9CARY|nr:hypothetical protein Cgig2_028648 [Carnegiea gigantea]
MARSPRIQSVDDDQHQNLDLMATVVTTNGNGVIKEVAVEDTQRKGVFQAALDKSKKDIPTFGHRMSISGGERGAAMGMANEEAGEGRGEKERGDAYAKALWRRRWGISSGAPKIGKMHDGVLDQGNHGDEFKRDFVEHVNWVIHKHGQLHLSKVINKLITNHVEGSSVSIPGVDVAAHYHELRSCDRIQVDHPLHTKGKIVGNLKAVDDENTLSAKFKAFIQEQYLKLLHLIYCARILMHLINKLTVPETAKKYFQEEQQSRKAT